MIKVITRVAVLAVAIVADSGVIEVRTAAVHIVAGLLPALDGSLDAKRGGTAWYGMGNDLMNQFGFSASTGLMKNGWATPWEAPYQLVLDRDVPL